MPQGVEVERFPFVVANGQEIAFLPLGAGLGIVLHVVQPRLASFGQIATEHIGYIPLFRHVEHARRRGLYGDEPPQFFGEVRLNVLPGLLLVLRVLRTAANVGLLPGQEKIGLREGPQFRRAQACLDGHGVQGDALQRVRPLSRTARQRRRPKIRPLRGQQHPPAQAPVRLGGRPLDASQGIVGQLAMIGQPLRKRLPRHDAPLDRSRGFPFGLHCRHDAIHTVRSNVVWYGETRGRADFADESNGSRDMIFAPLASRHHRLEVGKVFLNRPLALDRKGFLPGVDDAVTPQGNVGQLVRQDALGSLFVRGERVVLTALAAGVVPRNAVRAIVAPFEDAPTTVAAIAFLHGAFPFN